MTNGKVLVSAGPVDGVRNDYLAPTYFFEHDGAYAPPRLRSGQLRRQAVRGTDAAAAHWPDPVRGTDERDLRLQLLLLSRSAWRPQINTCPDVLRPLHTYTITGYASTALSQAVGYGDDAAAAHQLPLLRIRNLATGRVRYCRTFDHSTMGWATGSTRACRRSSPSRGTSTRPSEVCVVANGISST